MSTTWKTCFSLAYTVVSATIVPHPRITGNAHATQSPSRSSTRTARTPPSRHPLGSHNTDREYAVRTLADQLSRSSAPCISLTDVATRQTFANFNNGSVHRAPTYHTIGLSSSASHLDKSDTPPKELASRRALNDVRSTKKRAADAMKMATDAVKNHNELKRKEHTPEVIEISDNEPEVWPSKVRHAIRLRGQSYGLHPRGKKWTDTLDHDLSQMADLATPGTYQNWRLNSSVLSSIRPARLIGIILMVTTMTV